MSTWSAVGVHRNAGRGFVFDQGTNDTQRGKSEIFEGPGFGCCIEEGVEEKRDVG